MEIKHKIAMVTGAAGDLGHEVAKLLSHENEVVILVDALEKKDILLGIEQELPGSIAAPIDEHDKGAIKQLVEKILAKHWRIDILVNAAEEGIPSPVESIDVDAYLKLMERTIGNPLRMMQILIPFMKTRTGGIIVNVGSPLPEHARNRGAYDSMKNAMEALSLTARAELKKNGLIVGVVHPKLIDGDSITIDQPDRVASKIIDLIRSEAREKNA
jgi:NAD(P)-dependent dehydrogenase (short-subunit alcohol dehydrogenase family)